MRIRTTRLSPAEIPVSLQTLATLWPTGRGVDLRCCDCGAIRSYSIGEFHKRLRRGLKLLRCMPCHNRGQQEGRISNNCRRGSEHPCWNGGRCIDSRGYISVLARGHPHSHKGTGRILEHRLVMEGLVGRYLRPDETVHHKNGDKQDNRPENLELWNGRHGRGVGPPHCPTCTCGE